jgi:DNA polymerase I
MFTLVVDGNNMAYKNWVVNKTMCGSSGEGSGLLFGLYRTIISTIDKIQKEVGIEFGKLVICWDKGKEFRQDIYAKNRDSFIKYDILCKRGACYTEKVRAGYKGFRKDDPDIEDLYKQMGVTKLFFKGLGIKNIEVAGVEGDDVINYVSKKLSPSIILSGDTDFLQCVSKRVSVFLHSNAEANKNKFLLFTEKNFSEKYLEYKGFPLLRSSYISTKAVIGDVSDNIPGVSGIGEKTIEKALKEFNFNFEEFYNSKHKVAKQIKEVQELFEFSKSIIDLSYAEPHLKDAIENIIQNIAQKDNMNLKEVKDIIVRLELKQFLENYDSYIELFEGLR